MIQKIFYLFILLPLSLFAYIDDPFDYNLQFTHIPGKMPTTMICFHGMGGDYQIAHLIKNFTRIEETLVSFNFPDYDLRKKGYDLKNTHFGTIQELLPAIYVLKKVIVEEGIQSVNLYGFSAGGGAIINTLAVLNHSHYDRELNEIGVTQEDKKKILEVIQRGYILLDTPLKSLAEIIDFRGQSQELKVIGKRYQENNMEPIEVLPQLKDLCLHFIVHFQIPDEILSNRDDTLFIDSLKKHNQKGTTSVVIGYDAGHHLPHPTLWTHYFQKSRVPSAQ